MILKEDLSESITTLARPRLQGHNAAVGGSFNCRAITNVKVLQLEFPSVLSKRLLKETSYVISLAFNCQ
jgi:hypothetical protein